MEMKQALMTGPGEIVYNQVRIPDVGNNDVKIKIKKIGVCGSDIHVNHGTHPYTSFPVVQGHEVSGEVIEVGSLVSKFSIGDRVTVQPQVVCGNCFPCQNGMYNVCEDLKVMGFQTTGMASEYYVVNELRVTMLPDSITWEEGAMVEPLAVAIHAVQRVSSIVDKNVLVIGGGPIGNLVAQTAKAFGASNVVVSELSKARIDIAERCGLKTINSSEEELFDGILRNFGDRKADVIFECVGSSYTVSQAIEVARKGSTIVIVGVVSDLPRINMGFVQDHELTILGSAMYQSSDFDDAVELIEKGKVQLKTLITNNVQFNNYIDAYYIIENQKDQVMKVMIDMEESSE